MPLSTLRNPNPKVIGLMAGVLGVFALGQIVWDHRTVDAAETTMAIAPTPRPLVIAKPLGGPVIPPAPTLKLALPADPFRQLDQIGLDGYSLRHTAEGMGVDITPVAALDLAGIDPDRIDANDRKCLTQAIYYEARNQELPGQMAVADVVLNRVASKRYPNTICGVVYQGSQRETGCQFTFTCDGSLNRPIERRPMVRSQILATAVLGGFRLPLSADATNYHAGYVSPYWAPTLDQTTQVGDHIFYKRGANFDRYLREKASLTTG